MTRFARQRILSDFLIMQHLIQMVHLHRPVHCPMRLHLLMLHILLPEPINIAGLLRFVFGTVIQLRIENLIFLRIKPLWHRLHPLARLFPVLRLLMLERERE